MGIIDLLDNQDIWQEFYDYKMLKGHLPKKDVEGLSTLIETRAYLSAVQVIRQQEPLPPPQKLLLNKLGTNKKRTVYCFESELMWTLKLLAWLLYRFDHRQPEGCYSFRRNYGAHRAFQTIVRTPGIDAKWCCKLDISDYFNSIDTTKMLPIAADVFADDTELTDFFTRLLTADQAVFEGTLIEEQRGVMAGTPTSPFLANIYLRELDSWFVERGYTYARYSDDIIFFADSAEEIAYCSQNARRIIAEHGLKINGDKTYIAAPGEAWEFLGLSYTAGVIDLSQATILKLKGKIRRKARALRRWMLRKDASAERAQRAFIRSFNMKFYEGGDANDLTWSRWFFPILTTSESLKQIDHYLQTYVRYIATGRFSKSNYRLDYQGIKELGFRSLVNEYYRSRDESSSQAS
ncbi:MAG: reverse transcriptase domain-containing protein [Coriobacteriia bacterium]|nr:reverse transcriptase domain-containing protein [Coriobacteriia bacterium]